MSNPKAPASIPLSQTALLLIDIQQGLNDPSFGPSRSTPQITTNVPLLLSAFRSAAHKPAIIHVRHASANPSSVLHPASPGHAFEPYAQPKPSEPLFTKHVNSAFIGTSLEAHLRGRDIRRLVVCGITTDHCVSTTVRMAANLGVVGDGGEVLLVRDATAAHAKAGFDAELVHAVNLASLDGEFCRVVGTEELLRDMQGWGGGV